MIRVGPAGWSYPDWDGIVHPRGRGAGFHPLAHLARYVDCIEINSSFYATPRADFARRWVELVAHRPSFRFTAKLQGLFTHETLPGDGELAARVQAYRAGIEPLRAAGRLAALLVQFPFGFVHGPAAVERLGRLARAFGEHSLVLEVRHRSWFTEPALATIEALGYSLAAIDLPWSADHPPPAIPAIGPVGYVRLHGRNAGAWFDARAGRDQRYDYLYAPDELSEIVQLTRRLATGRDETFVITNNHFSGKAVANALELLFALAGEPPLAPAELIAAFPHLRSMTRADGQGSLF